MLDTAVLVKSVEHQAVGTLRSLLEQVPTIRLVSIDHEAHDHNRRADVVAHLDLAGTSHALLCAVTSSGQPRHVRTALLQLRNDIAHREPQATPVLIAPYLSHDAQALCREHNVGFLDLTGNARLIFGGVFIDRQVASQPVAERRELRSLFKPKSAQVLRVMLRDPAQAWRVTALAEAAAVSLGHVSNVRAGLLAREWAQVSDDGLFLSRPGALLDAWRAVYKPPAGTHASFYTTLHGSAFEDVARRNLHSDGASGLAAFASFSAAQWLAPYGRTGSHYFYADAEGLERLRLALKLSPISKGENVFVTVLQDPGVFRDAVEPAPGVICTSPVQTYLDLAVAGERGREAAEHLRHERLAWPT